MTRLRNDFDDLEIATKYIRAAHLLAGDDVGALRPHEFKRLSMYLIKSISIISGYQRKKDNPKSEYDIIVKMFDEHYPEWRKRCQTKDPVTARYCLIYFLNEYTQLTLKEIGKRIGHDCNRRAFDHSTIIHAIEKVKDMIDTKDASYMQIIFRMEAIIQDMLGIAEMNEIENPTINQEEEIVMA